ncbi:tRNA lysidine(34) synthetase TilS [Arenimonas fontis]|uniref:tRNA(Ile)-lysidine synthase n=1 Tax=Arenimonas fontis TaxID=2608255 RepID=A0A5B2ZED0_9GAMM|nr:tRNA lysidine(34) synthetase TilS [Arenimonas fontis]
MAPDLLEPLPAAPLLLAFSGGLDSTVLLHLLAAHPEARARGLRVLHVDHGLQPASAAWAEHCRQACAGLGLSFELRRARVEPAGEGLEAAARRVRYAILAEVQAEGEVVALAHHRDDQAETVLLRLLRGSADGLAGMRRLRRFGRGWLWRPLLDLPRERLLAHARAEGMAWIEDPSNQDPVHDRNYLRQEVMPRLRARWPGAGAALARSARLLAEQAALLAGEDRRRLAQVQGADPATLSLSALAAQPPAWRARLLRAWLAELELPPLPGPQLDRLAQNLLAARVDAVPELAWSGAVLRRWRDTLHAGYPKPPLPADWQAVWDGRAPLPLPGGGVLVLEPPRPFDSPVRVRARRGGERLRLPGRGHSSELRDLLQALGVPPWQRFRLPLLEAGDGEVLAAGDLAVSARLQAWLDAHEARLRLRH